MHDEPLVEAAGQIADGQLIDWPSMTSSLTSEEDRAIADELALVARIAAGHRELHQLLPAPSDQTGPGVDRARWGHLDLLTIVGRGSYGTVYRAWDTRLERLVALKLFHRAPDPDAVMREGRMLARVRHEHVVTVYGADVIDGVAGIWMELVHGATLDQTIKSTGPLEYREAASIGIDVARALAAIHAAQLLHCDVKAQNVVRESSGRVVLMDMGAGRPMPEIEDEDLQVAGTPRYMPPELFESDGPPAQATDVYGLGVLLYYLASGRFPVEGATYAELKQAHRERRLVPLSEVRPDLPAAFHAVVDRALAHAVSDRYESAAQIEEALVPLVSPPVKTTASGWKWATIAALLVAAALLVWQRSVGTPTGTGAAPVVRAIAVLPIKNLTGDPAKAYVADGLTEVLISNLARIRSLRVPSFPAVAPLRDSEDPPAAIAKTLGVQYLVAGSITQVESQFRMAVQLIDPVTGVAAWGEEIVREAPGMISAQAEIARMVAGRLALELSQDETRGLQQRPIDLRAQDVFLRGLAIRTATPTGRREAARLFREATEIDPQFAAAWAELALVEVPLAAESTNVDRRARAEVARKMAERSLQLDPALAAGYAALGTIQFYEDWDFETAERTLRRALAVDPSAGFPRQRLAMLLAARGRLDEAIVLGREAVRLEPLVPGRAITLGGLHYYARDFQRAEAEARRALQVSREFPTAHFFLGQIAAATGRHAEAITELQQAVAASDYVGWQVELVRVLTAAGRAEDARRLMASLDARERRGEAFSPDNRAYVAIADGRFDDAFRILEDAVARKVVNVLWLAVDPRVDPIRSDPRFAGLLTRMGLTR